MKKTFNFGKVNYNGTGKRNLVTVEVELETKGGEMTTAGTKTPTYVEFTACGNIWNQSQTDILCGGQCLDEIAKFITDPIFIEISKFWKKYHLNGMNAGTPEQEKAIADWKKQGNKYEYSAVCDYLKSINLYEVKFTGLSIGRKYENEPYKYGHAWIINNIDGRDLLRIEHLLST